MDRNQIRKRSQPPVMEKNKTLRAHMIIRGTVQGVGFRSWTKMQARALHIRGWVSNRADGTVEIVAEGSQEALVDFIERCHRGPEVSWVDHVQLTWSQTTDEFGEFCVI